MKKFLGISIIALLLTACSEKQLYNVEGEIVDVSCGYIRNTFITLDTGLTINEAGGSICDYKVGDKVIVYYDSDFEIKQLIVKE